MNPNEMPDSANDPVNGAAVNGGNPNDNESSAGGGTDPYSGLTISEIIDRLRSADGRADRLCDELNEAHARISAMAVTTAQLRESNARLAESMKRLTVKGFEAADELTARGELLSVSGKEIARHRRAVAMMALALIELTDDDDDEEDEMDVG